MMSTNNKMRFWRIVWTSRMGAKSPAQECWAKDKKQAGEKAKQMSRLADYPKTWSYKLEDLTDYLTEKERKRGY